jgi:hypothetical protein
MLIPQMCGVAMIRLIAVSRQSVNAPAADALAPRLHAQRYVRDDEKRYFGHCQRSQRAKKIGPEAD